MRDLKKKAIAVNVAVFLAFRETIITKLNVVMTAIFLLTVLLGGIYLYVEAEKV